VPEDGQYGSKRVVINVKVYGIVKTVVSTGNLVQLSV